VIFNRSVILITVTSLFLAGTIAGNFFVAPLLALFVLFLASLFLILVFNGNLRMLAVFWAAFFGGWLCFAAALSDYNDANKIYYYSGDQSFTAEVLAATSRESWQNLTVKAVKLENSGRLVSGKVSLSAPLYPEYRPGDQIRIGCKLENYPLPPTGYDRYLFKSNIFTVCGYNVEIKKTGERWTASRVLSVLSDGLKNIIDRSLAEPAAAILDGILLNRTEGMPKSINNQLSFLGLTHIIAISGSHLVIIMAILAEFFIFFGVSRRQSFWPATMLIIFYVVLVGAPASATRSAVMAILVLWAQRLGRPTAVANILLLAAAVLTLLNPKILLYDLGFELSFLAVVGLAGLSPIVKRFLKAKVIPESLQEIIAATLSAQILTYPLIFNSFGNFSFWSLPANLLILPTVPVLMTLGIIQLMIGLLCLPLARLIGLLSWLIIKYWLIVVGVLSNLPGAQIKLENFSVALMLIFYLLIFGFYRVFRNYAKKML
jgi:competence protein ComEC